MGAFALPSDMLDALALHGLRELTFAPIPVLARALAGFDRKQLGTAIEVMIAMLDAAGPDPEAEEDDSDCCAAHEDDASAFGGPVMGFGADHTQQDVDREITYPEWHTLPAAQRRCGTFAGRALDGDWCGLGLVDDAEESDAAEEDDPSGQCDEDEINTAAHWVGYTPQAKGAGCPISDPGGCQHDGREPDFDHAY